MKPAVRAGGARCREADGAYTAACDKMRDGGRSIRKPCCVSRRDPTQPKQFALAMNSVGCRRMWRTGGCPGAGSMRCRFPTRQACASTFRCFFQHGGRAENAVITEAASRPARAIDKRPRTPPYRHAAPAGADHFFSVITVFSDVLRAEKARPPVRFSIAGVWPRVALVFCRR